jgi:hypothetical protein
MQRHTSHTFMECVGWMDKQSQTETSRSSDLYVCGSENSQAQSVHFGGLRNLNPETQARCIHRMTLVFWVFTPCSMIGLPTPAKISPRPTKFRRNVLPTLCIRTSVQYFKLHWVKSEKYHLNFCIIHTLSSSLPSSVFTRTKFIHPEDRSSN